MQPRRRWSPLHDTGYMILKVHQTEHLNVAGNINI